jgi:hypothetical protein
MCKEPEKNQKQNMQMPKIVQNPPDRRPACLGRVTIKGALPTGGPTANPQRVQNRAPAAMRFPHREHKTLAIASIILC